MNRKVLILSIPMILLVTLFGGWLVFRGQGDVQNTSKQPELAKVKENPQVPSQPSGESQSQSGLQKGAVWYEIPELGIRFLTDQKTKNELVYHKDLQLDAVDFSTRTLEKISGYCTSELGSLSKVIYGKSKIIDPNVPCIGGNKVKDFKEGYFCYFRPQAPCLDKNEYEKNDSLLREHGTSFIPSSEDFWKAVEVFDSKN